MRALGPVAALVVVVLAVATHAAPDHVIKSPPDEREYVNSTVMARDFSCRAKCPLVIQCVCRNCTKGACVFEKADCTRWCACECENEKKYSGGY